MFIKVTPTHRRTGMTAPSFVLETTPQQKKEDILKEARALSGLGRFKEWSFDNTKKLPTPKAIKNQITKENKEV
jgi:hypothetical protein